MSPSRLRVFASSAVFSFRAQFGWLNPPMWLAMKIVMPFSQMAFFVYVAQYLVSNNLMTPDRIPFIAIGNAIQSLSWNTVFSVVNITGQDKWDGTLPLVLATPAQRLPLFVGRAMIHVFDGLLSVTFALTFAAMVFGVSFAKTDLLALVVVLLLTAFTMGGFGLLIGGLAFYFRDPMVFANIFTFILLIFCGVNFPVEALPQGIQFISYLIPLTFGLQAGRQVIAGSTLVAVSLPVAQMLIVGFLAFFLGFLFFRTFENSARRTGRLEAQ
jgi:ABC-2 type transport system permease protein